MDGWTMSMDDGRVHEVHTGRDNFYLLGLLLAAALARCLVGELIECFGEGRDLPAWTDA